MVVSNLRGLDDLSESMTASTLQPVSEAAQNMGVAQAIAVLQEEVEGCKNKLIKAQDLENGEDSEEKGTSSDAESDEEDESEQDSSRE